MALLLLIGIVLINYPIYGWNTQLTHDKSFNQQKFNNTILSDKIQQNLYYNLNFSTYFGGGQLDVIYSIAIDNNSNIFVTGWTQSGNIPTKNYNTILGGGGSMDIIVAKFDSTGNLIWSRVIGGNSNDFSNCIALDNQGNIFIAGGTLSTNFPTKNGINDTYLGGSGDGFIMKLNNTGGVLWSTYIGGSKADEIESLALDSFGNIYITGVTNSINFPNKNGLGNFSSSFSAGIEQYGGSFELELDSNENLVFSTLLGNYLSVGSSITVDKDGNSYISGDTRFFNLPFTTALNDTYGWDGLFVTKINSVGKFVWASYISGSGPEFKNSIALDSSGNIYVSGETASSDFPTKNGNNTYGGLGDAYILKLDTNGYLVWSTYLGGSKPDEGDHIYIDFNNNVYVTGMTSSSNFPIKNGYNDTFGGINDGFTSIYSSSGLLLYSSYIGGSYTEDSNCIAVDNNSNMILGGVTYSMNFPTKNAFENTYSNNGDAFLTKFTPTLRSPTPLTTQSIVVITPSSDKSTPGFNIEIVFIGILTIPMLRKGFYKRKNVK